MANQEIDRERLLREIMSFNRSTLASLSQIASSMEDLGPLSANLQKVLNAHYQVNHTPQMRYDMQNEWKYVREALELTWFASKALIRGYVADGKTIRVPEICGAMYIYDMESGEYKLQESDYTVHCEDPNGMEWLTILYVQTDYDLNVNNKGALKIKYSDCPINNVEMLLYIGTYTKVQPDITELLVSETAKSLEVIGQPMTKDGDYIWSAKTSSPITKLYVQNNLSVLTGCVFDTPSLVELYVPNSYSVPANSRGSRYALRKVDISNVAVLNNNALEYSLLRDDPETSCFFINVQSIGNSAFYSCSALQTVTMGDNVQSIGAESFRSCSALQTVALRRELQASL